MGEICLEYLVELGAEIDKCVDTVADIHWLPYFEVRPSGGEKTGLLRNLGHHRLPECAHRLLFGRTLAGWFTSGHQHQDEPPPNHANCVVDFVACVDPSLSILTDVPVLC